MTNRYSQTNLQLYNQMLRSGYSADDLELVMRCYGCAVRHLSGEYRSHGKPFITHLIGTASVLVALQAPAPVVGAGLLHAVYKHGDFGMEFPRSRRRARVRRNSSPRVEDLVVRYDRLDWTDATVERLRHELHTLDQPERDVVLMRLANELEDSFDRGLHYCVVPYPRQLLTGHAAESVGLLAHDLGYGGLAVELDQAMRQYRSGPLPPPLLRAPTTAAITVVTASYGVRPSVRIGRWVFSLVRPVLDPIYSRVTSMAGDR